ncbi:MAG: glycosyltransferase, partial [Minisyncoccia bacterium]
MKIVIATPFYPPETGVLGTYAEGLAVAFKKAGHEVEIAAFSSVKHLPPLVRHIAYFAQLRRRARGAGAMLALDTWSVGMPAFFAARQTGAPLLVRIGGDFLWEAYVERTKEPIRLSEFYRTSRRLSVKERIIHRFIRQLTGGANALLFNSKFQRDLWRKEYGFPAEKGRILENFFPPRSTSE